MSASPSHQDPPAARTEPAAAAPADRHGRGSWLLASAWQRMGVALLVCVGLWALTGWAMGWW